MPRSVDPTNHEPPRADEPVRSSTRPSADPVATVPADSPLRLHRNENPYGCSLLVQESLSIHDGFAQRPGPISQAFLQALGRHIGRPASDLYLTNTPFELLERVLRVCAEPGDGVIAYTPHTHQLTQAARNAGLSVLAAPRVDGKVTAIQALRLRSATVNTIFLGTPNDPTGDVVSPLEVLSMLRSGATVIADETYAEFTEKGLGILVGEFPSFISLRSFAPWAGLWGIPVSYAVAASETTARLDAVWPQVGLTAASRIAAGASLDDAALLLNRVKHIRLERARLYRRLRKLNFVQPTPSNGPFMLCEVTRGEPEHIVELLKGEGLLIHWCAEEGLPNHLRISVGTPHHTDSLITAMCRISVRL